MLNGKLLVDIAAPILLAVYLGEGTDQQHSTTVHPYEYGGDGVVRSASIALVAAHNIALQLRCTVTTPALGDSCVTCNCEF